MPKEECTLFLQWALPRLHLRWQGFRRVRRQVCRRLQERLQALELPDLEGYREFLDQHPAEWRWLEGACRITVSRFYRNRGVWQGVATEVLPRLATAALRRGEPALCCWSVGCASGEEPYTLALVWHFEVRPARPEPQLQVLATDIDRMVLERAAAARYQASSLRELPEAWRARAFRVQHNGFYLRESFRRRVLFRQSDIRRDTPPGPFHLIACRNLVFTYFAPELQHQILIRLHDLLLPEGALLLGSHECLPSSAAGFRPWPKAPAVYQKMRVTGDG